jgi:hypothetical protein
MKRAGDVIGVPQWQTDPLEQWEQMHKLSPDQERMKDAADSLSVAIIRLGECISWIDHASGDVDGMPEADRIMSFINSLEDLQSDLEKLQKKLAEGGE